MQLARDLVDLMDCIRPFLNQALDVDEKRVRSAVDKLLRNDQINEIGNNPYYWDILFKPK